MTAKAETCPECGLAVEGGAAGCEAIFQEVIARDFSDPLYFRVHRMLVDVYSLQHPARYCASAKSFAAHFTGIACLLEHGGNRATGSEKLRAWLNGGAKIAKPELPAFRGALTIADVRGAADPAAHERAVEAWARSTWAAYAPLHALARGWIGQALAR